ASGLSLTLHLSPNLLPNLNLHLTLSLVGDCRFAHADLGQGEISITSDALYPVSFEPSAPAAGTAAYLQDPSIRLLIDFFRNKGLAALKEEDRQEDWYQDWIDYQAKHKLYASVLSPQRYSSLGHRFNVTKLTRFLEVFAYF